MRSEATVDYVPGGGWEASPVESAAADQCELGPNGRRGCRRWSRHPVMAEYSERAVYCAEGAIEIDGVALVPGQMAVLRTGGGVDVLATVPLTVMVLGGEPIGQRYLLWNFVSSSRERLEQAAEIRASSA